jgi:hypothetical protein
MFFRTHPSFAQLAISLLPCLVALAACRPASSQSNATPETYQEVIQKMEERNAKSQEALRLTRSRRRYFAANPRLRHQAYLVVEARFEAPEEESFRVIERSGSASIDQRVFLPLLEAERANARSPAREAVEICRRNYSFTFESFDHTAQVYVFGAAPRTNNKYLFRGRIWVDAEDFAIKRVEGEPAQRPSFWVLKTHFVHEYGKFGDFWFPVRHRTEVELRLLGHSTLSIDYFDYQWQLPAEQARGASCRRPLTSLMVSANSVTKAGGQRDRSFSIAC